MKIHARPPPSIATTHELRQANMITPVLWYQSISLSIYYGPNIARDYPLRTTEEFIIELTLNECLMIQQALSSLRLCDTSWTESGRPARFCDKLGTFIMVYVSVGRTRFARGGRRWRNSTLRAGWRKDILIRCAIVLLCSRQRKGSIVGADERRRCQ